MMVYCVKMKNELTNYTKDGGPHTKFSLLKCLTKLLNGRNDSECSCNVRLCTSL
jgi:hypothetical protein